MNSGSPAPPKRQPKPCDVCSSIRVCGQTRSKLIAVVTDPSAAVAAGKTSAPW
ncbi:MAG: hypothetical protein PVH56_16115 [Desulfobacterales bacterium]